MVKAIDQKSNETVAVKIVDRTSQEALSILSTEAEILQDLKACPNIIQVKQVSRGLSLNDVF